jgi:hypothetical protein
MTEGMRGLGIGVAAIYATVALGAAVLVGGVTAAPASGAIKIYRTNQQATLVGKIRKGTCHVRGRGANRHFRARAESTNGNYNLALTILEWRGYLNEYRFRFGVPDPGVFYLRGPDAIYSNMFAPPRTNGNPAGGIGFRNRGAKISVGFLPTPNPNFRKGVVLAGMMRCVG